MLFNIMYFRSKIFLSCKDIFTKWKLNGIIASHHRSMIIRGVCLLGAAGIPSLAHGSGTVICSVFNAMRKSQYAGKIICRAVFE